MKKYIFIFIATVLAVSCVKDNLMEETLMPQNDVCVIRKGVTECSYDENSWQMGYNASENKFWACRDDMGEYFILTLKGSPVAGQSVKGDLTFTTSTTLVRQFGVKFEVASVEESGLIKLWNSNSSLGVVVMKLDNL